MQTDNDEDAPQPRSNGNSPNQSANRGGRPQGSMSRLAHEARSKAQETGMLPHEILLSMSRGEPQRTPASINPETGEVLTWKYEALPVADRRDAAKAAAPYYAPKISTVEVIAGVTDDDLDRIIAGLTAETSTGAGAGGKGSEDESAERAGDQPAPEAGARRERRSAKRID